MVRISSTLNETQKILYVWLGIIPASDHEVWSVMLWGSTIENGMVWCLVGEIFARVFEIHARHNNEDIIYRFLAVIPVNKSSQHADHTIIFGWSFISLFWRVYIWDEQLASRPTTAQDFSAIELFSYKENKSEKRDKI